jgi:(1->4)-alpha-D-glucan 1-alpha-D-glucosylmutase
MRFQQITGPVMAKGLEDTTFYVFNRLVSLNEVGGAPGRFGTTREAFHGQNLERAKGFPHTMLATATHDTKRGEDVRTRIDALSELPARWHRALVRWSALNKKKGSVLENQPVPDRNEEYLFYQILLGSWPHGELDDTAYERYRGRIREYMTKALREAKVNTSWVSPNQPYEEALLEFVDAVLERSGDNPFLHDFAPLQRELAHYGIFSSLSQVLLKMTSPGVPDFYQGSELWDLSLVDPDNRHQVDYAIRVRGLAALKEREAQVGARQLFRELLERREDGRIKHYLIYRCLNFRKENAALFREGDYRPLESKGVHGRRVIGFCRSAGERSMVVAAPRLVAGLLSGPDRMPVGEELWQDTFLALPHGIGARFRDALTGAEVMAQERHGVLGIGVGELFRDLPVALLIDEPAH